MISIPRTAVVVSCATLVASISILAQEAGRTAADPFAELTWRNIGPHRASRTVAAAGHRSHPYTFYMAQVNGGVWKTTDAGRTWKPIFDDQDTGSIGSIAVAPSDPNVVYAGSGEGLHRPDLSTGNGMYKSSDAGKTWTHLGLRDAQQIPNLAVDPKNANRLFVAALGHPYGPNEERGIFRSTDGGKTFDKVLYKDENTGGNDVDIDPSNPDTVYATMWEERQGPWENAVWAGTGGGIFKSVDGGTTWKPLTKGLPVVIQANIAISPANPQRIFAVVSGNATPGVLDQGRGSGGLYRSDDAGESWTKITEDNRPVGRIGGGDLPMPIPNPKDANTLIMASTVSWKSTDGGATWAPFKGAPGGEDYQNGWINPDNPDIMMLAVDQGAVVTLNGGQTWSSWYNQSTAQMYHVAADNAFPYRVCSGQQENGSACVASRGNFGAISLRDWTPVGVDEYGYVAPDPLNPDIVYGGRNVSRYDRRTGQVSSVGPIGGRGGAGGPQGTFRQVRTMPVVFSEVDKRALFFANNHVWKTVNGGATWAQISPDLTRASWDTPKSVGKYSDQPQAKSAQRGVIYTVAPSYQDASRIWIGTDDGLIQVTANGGTTWKNVTPPTLQPWAKVSLIDAGRFDPLTAYAAINTLRLDDMRPHILRTHDGGTTWTEIVKGIPDGEAVNAVREDPKRKGLLFAATERSVYVSFDDGANWRSLRVNLPVTSVRDIIVKDSDLVIATHGRGFWILDEIAALRGMNADASGPIAPATAGAGDAVVFPPATAWRVRWNMSTDMPWPIEEPTGQNPPDGAILSYFLKSAASDALTLEVLRADGRVVRRYSSTDPVPAIPEPASAPVPIYWYRQPQKLSTAPGLHRFIWDMHYQPLPEIPGGGGGFGGRGGGGGLPISAIPGNSAPAPTTPWVSPGKYTLRITANGKTHEAPIVVKQDPRVKTPAVAMQELYTLTDALYFGALDAHAAAVALGEMRQKATAQRSSASGATAQALDDFIKRAAALEGTPAAGGGGGRGGRGGGAPAGPPPATDTLWAVRASLSGLMNSMQAADVAPTVNTRTAITAARANAARVMARYAALKATIPAGIK